MKIEILGTGCASCVALENAVRQAVQETGIDAEIVLVKDIADIMSYGVMSTPALVVDGQVKSVGRRLGPEDVKKILA